VDATAQTIYHYTGLTGLMGIIQHKKLWATDVRYLNDTSESTYGDATLSALLEEEVSTRSESPAVRRSFLDNWRDFPKDKRIFVACFCAEDDLLSQWRGYGRLGYSIGFDRKGLEAIGGKTPPGYILRDMLYSKEEQSAPIKQSVDGLLSLFGLPNNEPGLAILPRGSYQVPGLWAVIAGTDLYELVSRLKHEAFRDEREVRAIYRVGPNEEAKGVELRETTLGPTPYVEIDVGDTPETTAIREIVIGPTPHKEEARDGVLDLLNKWGLANVTVRNSKIPFRW
jgi:hypothetical protein